MVTTRKRFLKAGVIAAVGAVALSPIAPSEAHDGSDTPRYGIVTGADVFEPFGTNDDADNGFRVFLSAPRHINSGSRGECINPGRQENVNGRQWNWMAANGNYFAGVYNPAAHGRNVHSRGYRVRVSANPKDGDYLGTITASQNFGSDVHIVTHSNAGMGGCGNASNYFLAMYRGGHANDLNLSQDMYNVMKDVAPGGESINTDVAVTGGTLAELGRNAPRGDTYIELAFHTYQPAQTWLYNQTDPNAYSYGLAIDNHLGYP